MNKLLPILLVVILVGAAAVLFMSGGEGTPFAEEAAAEPGLPAADYDWTLWDAEGREHPFASFKGKVVFLSFWATWCPPCVAEMPTLAALRKTLAGEDIVFALVTEEGPTLLKGFIEDRKIDLPFYRAASPLPRVFQTQGIPANFIIDAKGKIVLQEVGMANWNAPESVAFIRRVLRNGSALGYLSHHGSWRHR